MRLYPKLIPKMAKEIVGELMNQGDIEVEPESIADAEEDFASILREYQRQDDELAREASSMLIRRGWPRSKFLEAKRMAAAMRKFPLGDDGVDYLIGQMLELMLMSNHIEEVFAEDHVMRKRIVEILRRYLKVDEEVDQEVRARLKHLQEGTADWEIQYKQVSEQVRRKKGLI